MILALCSTGCASSTYTLDAQSVEDLKIKKPKGVEEECKAEKLPPRNASRTDERLFAIGQSAQLSICDAKRQLGSDTIDTHNRNVDRVVKRMGRRWYNPLTWF